MRSNHGSNDRGLTMSARAGAGAVACAALTLTAGLVASESEGTSVPAEPVGTVSTSMIEMLGNAGATQPVGLYQLQKDVLEDFRYTNSDGSGIDVAVIDTGVAPVPGLDGDKVLHGPDLSFEGADPQVAYLDTYGHGTHMAGIIAGDRYRHPGVAPGARIVSVKVAGHDGVTTVPQVVAAIDWVVDHRNTDGLNIKVLNLSLGQDSVTDHRGDLLSAAAERAWKAGIFVVVAGGNRGSAPGHVDSPAIDPYVMTVGGADNSSGVDEELQPVTDWSSRGDGNRNPDLVAPGLSIASYRVPGSAVDMAAPNARYGTDLFLGSGTSQSAAVISGVAARMFDHFPNMTNDQLKETLRRNTETDLDFGPEAIGTGVIDAEDAYEDPKYDRPPQSFDPAAGQGTGIVEPTGATWSGGEWSGATWSGATWSGLAWTGATWSGASWSGATWSGATWSGATWSGATWSGATWSGATWSGATWSGATWSGTGWS